MLQSNRKGAPSRAGSKRQETRPFVPDTVRISGLSVPIGTEPSPAQARPTPLPKPAVGLGITSAKKKNESSLLNLMVPKFARKGRGKEPPAPPQRDPTLEVSMGDVSIIESNAGMSLTSSTTELTLSDLSQVNLPVLTDPPPLPRFPLRRQSPWLVWSLVGGAWCVMIALALLAVDDAAPAASNLRTEARAAQAANLAETGAVALQETDKADPSLSLSGPAKVASDQEKAGGDTKSEEPAPDQESGLTAEKTTVGAAIGSLDQPEPKKAHGKKHHKHNDRRAKASVHKRKRHKHHRAASEQG
jgi:hypothetical protein